jgi:peptide deformylase
MPARRILQLGDPLLRQVSAPVVDFRLAVPVLDDLDDTLAAFRRSHGFGRGISAIQIGVALRVIFLRVDSSTFELINPAFTAKSPDTFELWDDCFSFPNLMVRLTRHCAVSLRHQDRNGAWREFDATGSLAELLQHELDHLDGILAVDHAAPPLALATREEWLRQNKAHGTAA